MVAVSINRFKNTETGIPEDWRVVAVSDIGIVGRGRVISHRDIARALNPRYPVYSSQTQNDGVMGYLDTYDFEGEYVTWTTDGANAGTVFCRNGKFNCTNVCGTIKLFNDDHFFVAAALNRVARQYVSKHLGNPKLMNDVMKQVKIAIPSSTEEQKRISEALSHADDYIASLEQLLAKKRAIMQGSMQELLTGKRRLPGYKSEWKTTQLSEVADIRSGGTPSTTDPRYWNGNIPWCTPTDITRLKGRKYISETAESISKEGLASSSAELLPPNTVLMTSRATIGECAINTVPCTTNQGFKNFIPHSISGEFLYYLLQTQKAAFVALCGGSTFLEIGKAQLSAFQITYPADIDEQRAIVAVLSDMDTELRDSSALLQKARDIKQGMMQELLTGKVRLI